MAARRVARIIGMAGILLSLYAQGAGAQQSTGYMQRLRDAEASVAALPANAWDATRSPEKNASIRPFSSALQSLGVMRSFVGDTEGAIAAFDMVDRIRKPRAPASAEETRLIDDATAEDAIEAIVAQARTRRVVLVNEAHNLPMNRAFSQRLARELHKIGYQYLACEAFDFAAPQAFPRGYAQQGGYYTGDPVFGGWIGEAIADGWKLVAYESGIPDPALTREQLMIARDLEQARNLVERIFARDSNAKVLIHVGYGHLAKGSAKLPGGAELVAMGEQLRRMTGFDMLHVDQTQFYAHPDAADESALYPRLLEKTASNAPFVLKSQDGSYAVLRGQKGKVDMQVVFPRYAFRDNNGRPAWLASLAGRAPREIPPQLLPKSGRRAVIAYRASDPDDAVPADIVVVEAGKPAPRLMLPKGAFRFAIED